MTVGRRALIIGGASGIGLATGRGIESTGRSSAGRLSAAGAGAATPTKVVEAGLPDAHRARARHPSGKEARPCMS